MQKINTDIRKELLNSISKEMELYGFKKKSVSFHRETEKGLYQIIDFRLGANWSIIRNHIGLDFGVATEEWINHLNKWKRPKRLTSADCEIRSIHLEFLNEPNDGWYKITDDLQKLENKIFENIKTIIIPFLDKVKTRANILELWDKNSNLIGLPPRKFLSIGILMYLNGEQEKGERILKNEYRKNKKSPFYTETIESILNKNPATNNV